MRTIAIALMLTACGAEPQAKTPSTTDSQPNVQAGAPQPATEEPQSFEVADASKLPACTPGREGALAAIRSEGRFVVCESGNWNSADLTVGAVDVGDEPAGANCPDGGQVVRSFLDRNGNGILDPGEPAVGQPKYICNGATGAAGAVGAAGAAGVDGAAGANGAAGVSGAAGANGLQGARGPSGALGVYNAQNIQIGVLLDLAAGYIMLPDGGFFGVLLNDGTYAGAQAYAGTTGSGLVFPTCGFTTTDCTGTCYMMNGSTIGNDFVPVQNAVVTDGHTLWRYAGDEAQTQGAIWTHSYWRMGSQPLNTCVSNSNNQINVTYQMTHAETLPAGVTYPFGSLHFAAPQ